MRTLAFHAVALLLSGTAVLAQPPPEETLEERVARLESQIASLETQLQSRTTTGAGSLGRDAAGLDVLGRVDRLERRIDALNLDLQRIAQRVDTAARDASEARRTAQSAERAARDAMLRR